MKSFLLPWLLVLGSCAHRAAPPLSDSAGDVPAWVYAPYEGCVEAQELCATGEGKTNSQADAQAKVNLASIFEVKIQSETSVATQAQQMPWQGQVKEEVLKDLRESVSQVLENVEIRKRFRKDGITHALASLDRSKGTSLLGGRMEKIDQELRALWGRRQRTTLRRIVKLFLERERLNERFSILSGAGRPSPVTWEQIIHWRSQKLPAEPLLLKVGQSPEWLTEKLGELLTEAGFRLVRSNATKLVTVQMDTIKEFLNVDGFEKYTFTLQIASIEDGQKTSNLAVSETVTGRTQADALLKVKDFFTHYIEEHLADLRLD